MFKFFKDKKYWKWSILGTLAILFTVWYKVQIDVSINEWFGTFYDLMQKALAKPGTVTADEIIAGSFGFAKLAGVYIVVAVALDFFARHWIFRWRTSMNDYYVKHWQDLRVIEGASQRVQEDTMRFARLVEDLGIDLMKSAMTLIAFLPLLWTLSKKVTEYPWIGQVDHGLVFIAILSAVIGTVALVIASRKLPGLEFNNQKVEAAYRKELVLGEDDSEKASKEALDPLYTDVRKNYFILYFEYLKFSMVKWSYIQGSVVIPYIALAPTLVSGAITLGGLQQISRAFGKVEESFQYLVKSWGQIVELISIHKRLKAFEIELDK